MMVRYLIVAAALVASLASADPAMARGRRGCSSCGGGVAVGCPGGVCAVPVAPGKYGVTNAAPPVVVQNAVPAAAAPVVATPAPAPRSYANYSVRRGVFGWRR
jgi:hypothetical protein